MEVGEMPSTTETQPQTQPWTKTRVVCCIAVVLFVASTLLAVIDTWYFDWLGPDGRAIPYLVAFICFIPGAKFVHSLKRR
ncbi:MAG: hypothetical protein ABID45_01015 [Patescibacteria group bacterium]